MKRYANGPDPKVALDALRTIISAEITGAMIVAMDVHATAERYENGNGAVSGGEYRKKTLDAINALSDKAQAELISEMNKGG